MAVDDVGGEDQRDLQPRFFDRRSLHQIRCMRAPSPLNTPVSCPRRASSSCCWKLLSLGGIERGRRAAAPGRSHQAELAGLFLQRHLREMSSIDEGRDRQLAGRLEQALVRGSQARRSRRPRRSARPGAKCACRAFSLPLRPAALARAPSFRPDQSPLTQAIVTGYMTERKRQLQSMRNRCRVDRLASNRKESMAEPTIRDVARRAQVSVASVSRALNGLDNVSRGDAARVEEAGARAGLCPPCRRAQPQPCAHQCDRRRPARRPWRILLRSRCAAWTAKRAAAATCCCCRTCTRGSEQVGQRDACDARPGRRPSRDGAALVGGRARGCAAAPALPAVLLNAEAMSALAQPSGSTIAAGATRHRRAPRGSSGASAIVHIAGAVGNVEAQERADAFRGHARSRHWTASPSRSCSGDYQRGVGAEAVRRGIAQIRATNSTPCSRPTT